MFLGAAVIIPTAAWLLGGIGSTPPESLRALPNLEPVTRAAPKVLWHLGVALSALAGGVLMLVMRKGTRLHRYAGRAWAVLMIGAAVTGVLVDVHRFTATHATALLVFWMVPSAVLKVRRGDIQGHRRTIAYLLLAMVIVAGLSVAPGHLLHGVFFQPASQTASAATPWN
jgi:uncharacterized membrane protein